MSNTKDEKPATLTSEMNTVVGSEGLFALADAISPRLTLVIQGETGLGKTEIVGQIGKNKRDVFYQSESNCLRMVAAWNAITGNTDVLTSWSYDNGLPVVGRRISQMTEGDLLGIPKDADSPAKGTQFTCSDWLRFVCEFPCILFLDERNRGIEAVRQGIFEMLDDHRYHGYKFHPGTYLFIAENVGTDYQVGGLDPAELSKGMLVTFRPSIQEWLTWARNNGVPDEVTDFIADHEKGASSIGILEVPRGTMREPGKKTPDRRAWTKLGFELKRLDMFEDTKRKSPLFLHLVGAFVGPELAIKFRSWLQTNYKEITIDMMLTDWKSAKKRLGKNPAQSEWIALSEKLKAVIGPMGRKITSAEAVQIGEFVKDSPPEVKMQIWTIAGSRPENMHELIPHIKDAMREVTVGKKAKINPIV